MTLTVLPGVSWQSHAACAGQDTHLFFRRDTSAARKICARCPVRAECLYDALVSEESNGIWGGLSVGERDALPALPHSASAAIAALREVLDTYDQLHPAPGPAEQTEQAPEEGVVEEPVATNAGPREDVAEMLRQGATYQQIKDQLSVSSHTVATTRAAYKIPLPSGRRRSPEEREANEKRTIELLRGGATYQQVKDEVGITAPTIVAIRRKAGLPDPNRGRNAPAPRTIAEGLAACIEPLSDEHARWTGPTAGRMPQLWAEGKRFNARHVIFERHHGRKPVGRVLSTCGVQACAAGPHLADQVLRNTVPEEPVTIRALTDLLDEIDREGGPQAARDNRLHLQAEEPSMATAPAPAPTLRPAPADPGAGRTPSENLPIGKLLKWAEDHDDQEVQAAAQRTRAALVGLRNRYDADHELAQLDTEAEQLEQRLAELRARRQELAPAKTKKRTDPNAAASRAWAKKAGVDCPPTGRVPKAVMDAWRQATGSGE